MDSPLHYKYIFCRVCCYDLHELTWEEDTMKALWIIPLFAPCFCALSLAQVPQSTWETGFSDQYKSENTLGEYTFGYNEDHSTGGSFRRETSDRYGNKMGSYGLRVGDGRVRVVNYVADENGFRADVVSNEPGVESQSSNPYSKITKKSIYSVLIPGFRYSSQAPYVTFQKVQGPESSYDVVNEEIEAQYETEQRRLDGEELGDAYSGQEHEFGNNFSNEEENFSNIYSDRDESFGNGFPAGEMNPNTAYTDEEEIYDDDFMDDEYKRASEVVSQNQTTSKQMEQGLNADATSVVVSESRNSSQENGKKDENGNNYQAEKRSSVKEDMHLSQSKIVLSKTSDSANLQGQNDTVLHDKESTNDENTTLQSTTVAA